MSSHILMRETQNRSKALWSGILLWVSLKLYERSLFLLQKTISPYDVRDCLPYDSQLFRFGLIPLPHTYMLCLYPPPPPHLMSHLTQWLLESTGLGIGRAAAAPHPLSEPPCAAVAALSLPFAHEIDSKKSKKDIQNTKSILRNLIVENKKSISKK